MSGMQKEAADYFSLQFQFSPGVTEKNHLIVQVEAISEWD